MLSKLFGEDGAGDSETTDMKYGLTLANRYAHMLGGRIALDYRQGGVTALTIDFPFKKVASEIVMPSKDDEKEAGAA